MKKTMLLILVTLSCLQFIRADELIDVYKTGRITLYPDEDFRSDDEWFESSLEDYTNIVTDNEENIYILDRNQYLILKFNQNGQLIQRYDLDIPKSTSVYHHIHKLDILDNKYLLIRGYAFILVLDLDGQIIKRIEFDYPIYDLTALKDNKVGIKGYVQLSNMRTKWHIAIVDIESESEIPVTQFIEDRSKDKESISFQTDNGWLGFSNPRRAPAITINRMTSGNLIVGNSETPDIYIYSIDGKLMNQIKLDYSQQKTNDEETRNFIVSITEQMKRLNAPDSVLRTIESPDFVYEYMPYYYGIKVDSDDNILVFKYTEEENHTFRVYQVYSKEGKFICETELNNDQFETPNLRLIYFFNDNLYALIKPIHEDSIQLIRVDIMSNE